MTNMHGTPSAIKSFSGHVKTDGGGTFCAFLCGVMPREYVRDARSPVPKSASVSAVMSRIRAKNTAPEKLMRSALSAAGIRGYRLHYVKAPGRPDIAFVGRKLALFVHGCFWHSCPHCARRTPRHNGTWWKTKLEANVARDDRKRRALIKEGWRVITVWECRLKAEPELEATRVARGLTTDLLK